MNDTVSGTARPGPGSALGDASGQSPAGMVDSPVIEPDRAAAIRLFDLGHAIEDSHLDAICRYVASQYGAPIALVTLVDETEQRFLGKAGTELCGTPRSTSFCATAMRQPAIMVVPDARLDARFADYSLVTGEPHLRFYAGAPLITVEGVPLGALCILDIAPRPEGLTQAQQDMLSLMADAVMDRLSLRRARREETLAAIDAAAAIDERDMRFRTLTDAMPQIVWACRPDGYTDYFNARWYEFTGVEQGSSEGAAWLLSVHPEDRDGAAAAWREAVENDASYDLSFRLRRADGEYRWTLTRGLPMRGGDGRILRWFGTCTDIHDHRLALEERELISQELSHRIKNIFAVMSGLVGLSARETPVFRPAADMLRQRILALGRAHDFVRPHSRDSRREPETDNSLHGLLHALFSPYESSAGERIMVNGADVTIDDRSATPLALLFHEVATNAAKYGALSVPEGRIAVGIAVGSQQVNIVWQEMGGPPLEADKLHKAGFGSRLLDLAVRRQLGGDFTQEWADGGLLMHIAVPLSAFSRRQFG